MYCFCCVEDIANLPSHTLIPVLSFNPQVHQAVIDAGETETGCTIHQVTEEVDGGPIMVQKVVQVSGSFLPFYAEILKPLLRTIRAG